MSFSEEGADAEEDITVILMADMVMTMIMDMATTIMIMTEEDDIKITKRKTA